MPYKYNPFLKNLDYYETGSSSPSPYITEGSDGILTIRMESDVDASVWDMTVNEYGAWVSTLVSSGSTVGTPMGLLLSLTYST